MFPNPRPVRVPPAVFDTAIVLDAGSGPPAAAVNGRPEGETPMLGGVTVGRICRLTVRFFEVTPVTPEFTGTVAV
jgi:hypothetical protein